jgi:hypothetical protein
MSIELYTQKTDRLLRVKKMRKILLWTTILSFGMIVLTTIPLLINYLKGTEPKFPIFVHLHVWFGVIFLIAVIIRMIMNRKILKAKL